MLKTVILVVGLLIPFVGPAVAAEDEDLFEVYYQSGMSLFKRGNYEEAIGKFTEALAYRPNFSDVSLKLGECYEKIKNYNKAINNYRFCAASLRQLAERSKEQNEMLVEVNKRLDKLDVRGREIKNIRKNHTDKLLALARDCISKKYNRFAIRILEYILQIDPDNKAARELLAKLTIAPASQQKKEPKITNPEETKVDKRMAKVYLDKSDNYLLKGDYEKALASLSDAIKADPKSIEGFVNMRPSSETARRNIDNVLADLNEKIALNPQFYAAYYVRSVLNAKMGNYRSAVTDANIALNLAPKDQFATELKKTPTQMAGAGEIDCGVFPSAVAHTGAGR
ncbi:MAG: tetratricopeptide repeat protein [Planctomycetes bacterium]|nr:tetratricopeptide repeat protein [Planctomycetota bacterium]